MQIWYGVLRTVGKVQKSRDRQIFSNYFVTDFIHSRPESFVMNPMDEECASRVEPTSPVKKGVPATRRFSRGTVRVLYENDTEVLS
jgi:hypothetical protein